MVGSLLKIDFLKLQMRYVDGLEVGVNGTKKLGGGTKLWIMQLKRSRRLRNSGKVETLRKSI